MKQRTIGKELVFHGIGVHFGLESRIILKPASVGTGIVFINPKNAEDQIKIGSVIPEFAMHASVVKGSNWTVSTVEHLMAALIAFYVDNVIIEFWGVEAPILDGSSLTFVDGIKGVGVVEQDAQKPFLTPTQEIKFEDNKGRFIQVIPAQVKDGLYDKGLYINYSSEFEHALVGKSDFKINMTTDFFVSQIAPARTFGFLEQLPYLRSHGLAKGTTLGNTVVIGEEEFLNDKRFEDEFARHKILDLLGDLGLLGKNLVGTVVARKTGHNFNRLVVEHYIKNPDKWILVQ